MNLSADGRLGYPASNTRLMFRLPPVSPSGNASSFPLLISSRAASLEITATPIPFPTERLIVSVFSITAAIFKAPVSTPSCFKILPASFLVPEPSSLSISGSSQIQEQISSPVLSRNRSVAGVIRDQFILIEWDVRAVSFLQNRSL